MFGLSLCQIFTYHFMWWDQIELDSMNKYLHILLFYSRLLIFCRFGSGLKSLDVFIQCMFVYMWKINCGIDDGYMVQWYFIKLKKTVKHEITTNEVDFNSVELNSFFFLTWSLVLFIFLLCMFSPLKKSKTTIPFLLVDCLYSAYKLS